MKIGPKIFLITTIWLINLSPGNYFRDFQAKEYYLCLRRIRILREAGPGLEALAQQISQNSDLALEAAKKSLAKLSAFFSLGQIEQAYENSQYLASFIDGLKIVLETEDFYTGLKRIQDVAGKDLVTEKFLSDFHHLLFAVQQTSLITEINFPEIVSVLGKDGLKIVFKTGLRDFGFSMRALAQVKDFKTVADLLGREVVKDLFLNEAEQFSYIFWDIAKIPDFNKFTALFREKKLDIAELRRLFKETPQGVEKFFSVVVAHFEEFFDIGDILGWGHLRWVFREDLQDLAESIEVFARITDLAQAVSILGKEAVTEAFELNSLNTAKIMETMVRVPEFTRIVSILSQEALARNLTRNPKLLYEAITKLLYINFWEIAPLLGEATFRNLFSTNLEAFIETIGVLSHPDISKSVQLIGEDYVKSAFRNAPYATSQALAEVADTKYFTEFQQLLGEDYLSRAFRESPPDFAVALNGLNQITNLMDVLVYLDRSYITQSFKTASPYVFYDVGHILYLIDELQDGLGRTDVQGTFWAVLVLELDRQTFRQDKKFWMSAIESIGKSPNFLELVERFGGSEKVLRFLQMPGALAIPNQLLSQSQRLDILFGEGFIKQLMADYAQNRWATMALMEALIFHPNLEEIIDFFGLDRLRKTTLETLERKPGKGIEQFLSFLSESKKPGFLDTAQMLGKEATGKIFDQNPLLLTSGISVINENTKLLQLFGPEKLRQVFIQHPQRFLETVIEVDRVRGGFEILERIGFGPDTGSWVRFIQNLETLFSLVKVPQEIEKEALLEAAYALALLDNSLDLRNIITSKMEPWMKSGVQDAAMLHVFKIIYELLSKKSPDQGLTARLKHSLSVLEISATLTPKLLADINTIIGLPIDRVIINEKRAKNLIPIGGKIYPQIKANSKLGIAIASILWGLGIQVETFGLEGARGNLEYRLKPLNSSSNLALIVDMLKLLQVVPEGPQPARFHFTMEGRMMDEIKYAGWLLMALSDYQPTYKILRTSDFTILGPIGVAAHGGGNLETRPTKDMPRDIYDRTDFLFMNTADDLAKLFYYGQRLGTMYQQDMARYQDYINAFENLAADYSISRDDFQTYIKNHYKGEDRNTLLLAIDKIPWERGEISLKWIFKSPWFYKEPWESDGYELRYEAFWKHQFLALVLFAAGQDKFGEKLNKDIETRLLNKFLLR